MSNINKELLKPGWRGVHILYSKQNLAKSLILPSTLSVVSIVICAYSKTICIEFLSEISNILFVASTSILGFTLSGYALMVGLSDSQFIRPLMNPMKKDGISMFQKLNSTFAVVLYVTFLSILSSSFIKIALKAKIEIPNVSLANTLNWISLFILLFLLFYTINTVKDIVINIFNFGQFSQTKHLCDTQKKENEDNQN